MDADPLAHVGPSDAYMSGYRDGLICVVASTPHPPGSVEASEYEEGYLDACADVVAGVALASTVNITVSF